MENVPIYQRNVEIDGGTFPSFTRSEKESATAIDSILKTIKDFNEKESAVEESINLSRYQNMVLESAARAYHGNPTDLDGYRKAIRESLKDFPIPMGMRHEYAAILLNGESRYFHAIMAGKEKNDLEEENNNLMELADALARDAIFTMGGKLPPAVDGERGQEDAGDALVSAGDIALTAAGNGDPRGLTKVADYAMGAMEAYAVEEIGKMDDPIGETEGYLDGVRPLEVKVSTSMGTITLSSSQLPPDYQEQLKNNIYESVKRVIRTRSDREYLERGMLLANFPANYLGTNHDKKALDVYGNVQLQTYPLTPDTIGIHMGNMKTFAKNFKHVPAGYVEEISSRINGMRDGYGAAAWSNILWTVLENGGEGVARQFTTDTLMRSQLINDMVFREGVDPGEALTIINGLKNNTMTWENVIALNRELVSDGKNLKRRVDFYGSAVTAEKYGERGVEEYDGMVRTVYLTNGGNVPNAQKVAKKWLDAVYGTTQLGHYGRGWWHRRRIKYPPEAYYPSHVVRNVIRPSMENIVIPHIRDELGYGDIGKDNYILVANDATAQAFYQKGEGGRPPAWEVWYVNGRGSHIPVFDGAGNVFMYSPDRGALASAPQAMEDIERDARKGEILRRARKIASYDLGDDISQEVWEAAMEEIENIGKGGE